MAALNATTLEQSDRRDDTVGRSRRWLSGSLPLNELYSKTYATVGGDPLAGAADAG